MRIYGLGGAIPFKTFTFPDGQQHVEIQGRPEDAHTTIEARIATSQDLMDVVLAKDALNTFGGYVDLDIRYLAAGRMDRRIGVGHPLSLEVVARIILSCGFRQIRVLDPHSKRTLDMLGATALWPESVIRAILSRHHPERDVIVLPDAGAQERVPLLVRESGFRLVGCRKRRDAASGVLSGFEVGDPEAVAGKGCLIVDDICDGGRTFVGQAAELRKVGARRVDLYVTHGIFSNGLPLQGIDMIFTTDSYAEFHGETSGANMVTFNVLMDNGR